MCPVRSSLTPAFPLLGRRLALRGPLPALFSQPRTCFQASFPSPVHLHTLPLCVSTDLLIVPQTCQAHLHPKALALTVLDAWNVLRYPRGSLPHFLSLSLISHLSVGLP